MHEALRYYIHARAHYLNAKAEKLNPSPTTLLARTLLPLVAQYGAQVLSRITGSEAPPEKSVATGIYSNRMKEPGTCPVCKANMLPGDSHTHTAESEEMWKNAPDWTKSN